MTVLITKDQLREILKDVLEDINFSIESGDCRTMRDADSYLKNIPEKKPKPATSVPDARNLFAGLEEHFTKRLQAKTGWGRNEVLVEFKHAVSEALFAFMEK